VNEALKEHNLRIRFVQNRFYASTGYDRDLRKYCIDNDIVYQSFWTLTASKASNFPYIGKADLRPADPHVLSSSVVKAIAKRLNITKEQVFYQFCIQQGITPLNGTTNEERMKLGVAVLQGQVGELTQDEVASIGKLLE
jgi:diketogulonate reductase-like aldo/keto reductase